ncbi:hypothetical protein BC834DRAFT_909947 [Gloeopeniophorella convolvens]|nr:hypothetical protein BC834DRAFT_909947 [Gloeopeniophorella convolvens]
MGNTLSDLLIATSMVYYLTRQAVNGNLLSDRAITMIVRLTVETNALTTIVGVTTLSMVAMFPDKNWFTCPVAVLGKLYSNTLLVTLNNRISIRDASESSIRTTPDPRFTIRPAHTAERFSLNRIGMTSSDDSESKIIDYRTALAI